MSQFWDECIGGSDGLHCDVFAAGSSFGLGDSAADLWGCASSSCLPATASASNCLPWDGLADADVPAAAAAAAASAAVQAQAPAALAPSAAAGLWPQAQEQAQVPAEPEGKKDQIMGDYEYARKLQQEEEAAAAQAQAPAAALQGQKPQAAAHGAQAQAPAASAAAVQAQEHERQRKFEFARMQAAKKAESKRRVEAKRRIVTTAMKSLSRADLETLSDIRRLRNIYGVEGAAFHVVYDHVARWRTDPAADKDSFFTVDNVLRTAREMAKDQRDETAAEVAAAAAAQAQAQAQAQRPRALVPPQAVAAAAAAQAQTKQEQPPPQTLPLPQEAAPLLSGADQAHELHKTGEAHKECTICAEHAADHAMVPCGHVCVCGDCYGKHEKQLTKCPICRAQVKMIIKTFFA